MSRKAMQMALEALELLARYENPSTKIQVRKPKEDGSIVTMYPHKVATEAAALLRERLAQPNEFEPDWDQVEALQESLREHMAEIHRLRQWQGLTDQEINSVCYKRDWTAPWTNTAFARAIEAKLREKNHG